MTTDAAAGAYNRLYGMMQHLMICAANGQEAEEGPRRDVVTTDDALAARVRDF